MMSKSALRRRWLIFLCQYLCGDRKNEMQVWQNVEFWTQFGVLERDMSDYFGEIPSKTVSLHGDLQSITSCYAFVSVRNH